MNDVKRKVSQPHTQREGYVRLLMQPFKLGLRALRNQWSELLAIERAGMDYK